jgi:hypothetical protein
METMNVTIPLDPATAEAYVAASPEDQRKMHLLFRLLVQGYTSNRSIDDMFQLMDTIGANAQKRGLTPEILEQILNTA